MRALSIRQPYAELILRGIKPIEFRSRPTKIIGERFYIYASRQWAAGKLFLEGCRPAAGAEREVWSHDLAMPDDEPQPWMTELARMLILKDLPMGVIVGSAVISNCEKIEDVAENRGSRMEDRGSIDASTGDSQSTILEARSSILNPRLPLYGWHLTDVQREKKLRKPKGHPQPVWFTPF
jgi:hypothetical protein